MLQKILLTLVILLLAGFAVIYWQNSQAPELGVVDGKLKPLSSKPNCVSSQAQDINKLVPVLEPKATLKATREAILKSIESYGGAEIVQQTDDYIYAVFVTPTMKYRDDVEFWINTADNEVHFRSSSRAGYSDRGLNRQRYNELANAYRANY